MQPIESRGEIRISRFQNHTGNDDRTLRRAAAKGLLVRLRTGAYVSAETWRSLPSDDRERLAVAAAYDLARSAFVASHRSAAALWQVPRITRWNGLIDVRASPAAGSRTEHGFRKHATRNQDLHVVAIDGVPCTSLERTVVDLALAEPFADAVVAADWALRTHTSRDALHRTLDELDPKRGRRRAEAVLAFADARSDSPGESWSRVQIAEAGLPAPQLQVRFEDGRGLIGFVDFYWPEFRLIGEFDGAVKYADPAMLAGRSSSQAVMDEKRREDRLRATGPIVTRWMWDTLTTDGRSPGC